MSPLNPHHYRSDFPILQRTIHGKPLVYLDNAATTQKPEAVITAIAEYYRTSNANVHRGVHQLGDESTKIYHDSRRTIADFFGADPEELIVVRNTTEAINQLAYTWGESHISAGDCIITTEMEHHSNIVPWQQLAARKTAQLLFIPVNKDGTLDLVTFTDLLRKHHVKLVTFTHVSNTLGTLNPVTEIIQLVRTLATDAKVLIDGAQAAAHLSINFHSLDADFYVVSAHKMLGPMGIGGLFIKKKLLTTLPPFLFGGGMISEVTTQQTSFADDLEERFTAGTPDVAGLVGWAAACQYLTTVGMARIQAHDHLLVSAFLQALSHHSKVRVIGPLDAQHRVGSVALEYQHVHAHDVGQILDSEGVAVRSGHHCTMPLHLKFGWPATVRASFQLYNTLEEADVFMEALEKVEEVFRADI